MSFKRFTLMTILAGFAYAAFSCGQQEPLNFAYSDYIYGINNFVSVTTAQRSENATTGLSTIYSITNNHIVDLPLTVYVKLTSNSALSSYGGSQNEIVQATLQYRILGKNYASDTNGWTTVKTINKKQGTISINAPPGAYFGRNNIDPPNIQPGDVILIRYYLTDGYWQSSDLSDTLRDCSYFSPYVTVNGTRYYTLLPSLDYEYTSQSSVVYCGSSLAQFVTTVIWSGKRRPVK